VKAEAQGGARGWMKEDGKWMKLMEKREIGEGCGRAVRWGSRFIQYANTALSSQVVGLQLPCAP